VFLDRVLAVRFYVLDVVQEVESRRESAEGRRDRERAACELAAVRDLAEQDRREDEEVLDPLGGPKRAEGRRG